jgi:3-oxoadipate enol-lactonase/4-carboxymuconolactone decarboxylase
MSAPRAGSTRFAVRHNSRIAYDPGVNSDAIGLSSNAVILLHDLLADRTTFVAQRAVIVADVRVITPDARGHGASATLANRWYTVAELAQDVLAIMDLEWIFSADLVGHGLGGATAFELARRFGYRVTTLTLIEPALYALLDNDAEPAVVSYRNELRASDRAAADAAYKGLIDKAIDAYLLPRWGSGWRDLVSKPRLAAIRRHAASLSALLPALDAYTIAKNDLRQLLVPTVIVTGQDAQPIDRLSAVRLAALLPVVRVTTVPLSTGVNGPFGGEGAHSLNKVIADSIGD